MKWWYGSQLNAVRVGGGCCLLVDVVRWWVGWLAWFENQCHHIGFGVHVQNINQYYYLGFHFVLFCCGRKVFEFRYFLRDLVGVLCFVCFSIWLPFTLLSPLLLPLWFGGSGWKDEGKAEGVSCTYSYVLICVCVHAMSWRYVTTTFVHYKAHPVPLVLTNKCLHVSLSELYIVLTKTLAIIHVKVMSQCECVDTRSNMGCLEMSIFSEMLNKFNIFKNIWMKEKKNFPKTPLIDVCFLWNRDVHHLIKLDIGNYTRSIF